MGKKTTSPKIIAHRYAQALYDLAVDKKALKPVFADLVKFGQSLEKIPSAVVILSDPKTPQDQRQAAIDALSKKGKAHALSKNFFKLLVKQNRFDVFDHIVTEFQEIYDAAHNIHHVEAVTAAKLNKEQQKALEENLKTAFNADEIALKTIIDPSVLGGIRLRFGSTLVDDTIKNKLNRIAQKMKGIA